MGTQEQAAVAAPAAEESSTLKKATGAVALTVFGIALGGVAGANNWYPHFDDSPPKVYAAKANYSDVQARVEARLTAPVGHTFEAGSAVHAIGFCIGASTLDRATSELDQRWWVLGSGLLLPYPDASGEGPAPPLRGCARAGDEVGGPHFVALTANLGRDKLLLSAKTSEAVTLGFALLAAPSGRWLPAALLRADHPPVRVVLRTRKLVVEALAVACWGPGGPATPTDATAPVLDLKPLAQESAALQRTGSQRSAPAAADICRRSRYGVFLGHPPPPRPRRPKTRVIAPALAAPMTPEVPGQSIASPPPGTLQKARATPTNTGAAEPPVTTGPEERTHVAHRE
jgi:hypothetical protein